MGWRFRWTATVVTMLGATPLVAPGLFAQDLAEQPVSYHRTVPTLQASRLQGPPPVLDGRLEDAPWASAEIATDFVQFEPDEGASPTERTEARVLYGADALYVAMRAFDRHPDEIVAQLARRDEDPHSDWLEVVVDSYDDRRTAFRFGVNPAGVKKDTYHFDDTNEDGSWDAVWDVATSRDDSGWTAEFRIPYSQLRFGPAAEQSWGINFVRVIARHQETSVWAPLSRGESAIVSRFGRLQGLRDLSPPRRLEVLPYSLVRMAAAPGDNDNPFYDPDDFFSTAGADLKYGVTSNLTLDVTINPDFGQVEADPAQLNLTAFETFFPEQRPFFIEGANIFNFRFSGGDGDGANEGLFYSRRIGRAPQGSTPSGEFNDAPAQTSILGAMKLSGKTPSGWSIGILNAVTGREEARLGSGGAITGSQVVEPRSNYGVARLQRDFRDGRSAAGVISTWTNRGEGADALGLRNGAYTGGLDGRHRFGEDRFEISGYLLGSHVTGTAEAISATQTSPARYFQRPDADHVEHDPTRTSLSGWAGSAVFNKIAGGYWRYATGVTARSPGFEANDLGFMRETDFISPFVWIGHNHYNASEHFQRWNLNLNAWSAYSFGGERYNLGGNVNGSFTLSNFWGGYMGVMRQAGGLSNSMLRGGPMFRRDPAWGGWFGLWSDSRKSVGLNLNNNWNWRPESGSWNANSSANVRWRPSSQANVSVGPFITLREEDMQWVRRLEEGYVFGRLDQTTVGMTIRADWTFTPTLSLQLYGQPFVSAGRYGGFKTVANPVADRYGDRIRMLDVAAVDGSIGADVDGDGSQESFSDPDFNVKQFRSNAVLRWEYRPGSALFLVWSQGRDHFSSNGEFDFTSNMGTLFGQRSEDVFLIKLSYWVG